MTGHIMLLVFDWDGTLVDSEAHIISSMQTAMKNLGLSVCSVGEIRNIIGLGLDEAILELCPRMKQKDRQKLADAYRKQYLLTSNQGTPLFPTVRETLQYLRNAGYLLAVATGKSRRGLDRSLKETELFQIFHTSRCADETFSKPHPQMLKEIMEITDIPPENTIMIGDSEYDLQMANNAGTASIAVTYGTHNTERLLQYGPLTCLNVLHDLRIWLDSKNIGYEENI